MLKKAPDVETSNHFSYSLYNMAMVATFTAVYKLPSHGSYSVHRV